MQGKLSAALKFLDMESSSGLLTLPPDVFENVLLRIIGKTVSWSLNDEIKEAASPLRVGASHSAGAEAAIHGMSHIFADEETDGILLVDVSNAFNQMNRSVALHNILITCPEMSLYIINT